MTNQPASAITQLLDAATQGDAAAIERLWPAAHDEVRAIARAHLAREGRDRSLQTTELVDEVYIRLGGNQPLRWENRRHFFGAVAKVIREILIDNARRNGRLKRGGGRPPDPLLNEPAAPADDPVMILAIDEALEKFEQIDALAAKVVTLRYFIGLSVDETASALDVSPRTVDNKWQSARPWLHRELCKGDTTWSGRARTNDA
jgi:RNA polymerase sigma factor (TIGR02999 family)